MIGEWDERFVINKGAIRWNYNRHSLNVHVRLHYYSLLLENWQKSLTIDYKAHHQPCQAHFYVPRNCYWIISLHKWRLYTLAHNSKSYAHYREDNRKFWYRNFPLLILNLTIDGCVSTRQKISLCCHNIFSLYETLESFFFCVLFNL